MIVRAARAFSTQVWMEVTRDGTRVGAMKFRLYDKECPKTVFNFKSLLTGVNQDNLSYKGVKFHRIVTDFMA